MMADQLKEWLLSLKAGDEVAAHRGGGWSSSVEILSVDRTTPSQIIVGSTRYRRENGREVGRHYGKSIVPATQDVRDEIDKHKRKNRALAVVGAINWHNQPLEVLEAMAATYLKVRTHQP